MSDTPEVDAFLRAENCSRDNPVAFDWLVGLARHLERRANASLPEAAWRTMDSAPEAGTVLLNVPTLYGKHNKSIPVAGMRMNGFWVIFNADEAVQRVEPTHWMPLPSAPTPQEGSS